MSNTIVLRSNNRSTEAVLFRRKQKVLSRRNKNIRRQTDGLSSLWCIAVTVSRRSIQRSTVHFIALYTCAFTCSAKTRSSPRGAYSVRSFDPKAIHHAVSHSFLVARRYYFWYVSTELVALTAYSTGASPSLLVHLTEPRRICRGNSPCSFERTTSQRQLCRLHLVDCECSSS
jgi:hypothetical protein